MAFSGANIQRGAPGANTLSGADSTSGLCLHGLAVAGKIALGDVKTLFQLKDAEALGIDKAYDAANNVRVWYNIKEFYRFAPRGTKLFILLADNTLTVGNESNVTMEDMVNKDNEYVKKLIVQSEGEVKQWGAVLNPATGYTSTILNGLDADVQNAIPVAKALVDWSWETDRPTVGILEGREFTGTAAAAQDLRDITNVEAEGVGVAILQDWAYADGLDVLGKKHAAVGTALGVLASLRVDRNMGEVETKNLTNAATKDFITVGISSHEKVVDIEDDLSTLDSKGYLFALKYTGYDGYFFNGDHCACPVVVDSEGQYNHYSLSFARTAGKAARLLRNALLPKVKSTQRIDSATGKLDTGTVKFFDALGDDVFQRMEEAGEISGGKTYTNPDSDLLTPPRVLQVDFSVVPNGTIDSISGSLNLKRSI